MTKRKIILLSVLTCVLALFFTIFYHDRSEGTPRTSSTLTTNRETVCWNTWQWKIHKDHNDYREAIGLHPLMWSEQLTLAAKLKVAEMYDFKTGEIIFWDHKNPMTERNSTWEFIETVGYDYVYAGENISRDFMDYHAMFESWVFSPKHLENIESTNYTHIGIYSLCDDKYNLTVAIFGTL